MHFQNEISQGQTAVRVSELNEILTAYAKAVGDKDVNALLELYDLKHVAYDVVPPFKREGIDAAREAFNDWFNMYTSPIELSFEDVKLYANGPLAVIHALVHTVGDWSGGQHRDGWLRSTLVLVRKNGGWKIVHDHASMPFNMKSMKPVMRPESELRH